MTAGSAAPEPVSTAVTGTCSEHGLSTPHPTPTGWCISDEDAREVIARSTDSTSDAPVSPAPAIVSVLPAGAVDALVAAARYLVDENPRGYHTLRAAYHTLRAALEPFGEPS